MIKKNSTMIISNASPLPSSGNKLTTSTTEKNNNHNHDGYINPGMPPRLEDIHDNYNDDNHDDGLLFDADFDNVSCQDYSYVDAAAHQQQQLHQQHQEEEGHCKTITTYQQRDDISTYINHHHHHSNTNNNLVARGPYVRNGINNNNEEQLSLSMTNNISDDDTALARAIAEQELPPGVSVAEQQEIMMRLLTQRIRCGPTTTCGGEGYNNGTTTTTTNGGGGGGGQDYAEEGLSPALQARLRDFNFAQNKRRENYGEDRPWGILGLYDHLAGIRLDVEWAEDAAWRRSKKEPYLSWTDFQTTHDAGWNRPFFTYTVLLVCTIVQIVSYGMNGWRIEPLSVNPMIGPSSETLIQMGAKYTVLIVDYGEWYRLFSPMVLHAGLIHYFLNMTALWFIGQAVEQCHGTFAATILFFIPAVGGTILSAIFLSEYISVGASGGIFGLIGACIADICMNWSLLFSKHINASDEGVRFRHMKVLLWLLFDIVINCLIGLTPFVDNFTHLGGMVYGFLCGLSTMERLSTGFFGVPTTTWGRVRDVLIRCSGLIISVVLIMITTAVLVDMDVNGPSPCPGCRYLSCVPFPPWAREDKKWWYCDDCSRVTADAKLDPSGYYSLLMTCPNGDIEDIDLSDQLVTDRQWIQSQLPKLCRLNCDQVFGS